MGIVVGFYEGPSIRNRNRLSKIVLPVGPVYGHTHRPYEYESRCKHVWNRHIWHADRCHCKTAELWALYRDSHYFILFQKYPFRVRTNVEERKKITCQRFSGGVVDNHPTPEHLVM